MNPSPNKVSQVRLRDPRWVAASASPAELGVAPRQEAGSSGRVLEHHTRAVMVVDDDHDLRTTIQSELEERGYLVYGAANGMEAINILRQVPPPQLILLDLMMPIMNGWDFLQSVKGDASLANIPVTVLTWLQHTKMPDSPVLMKPLDLRTLIDLVEQHAAA
jgi:CheY-like chemotaxis protein